MLTFYYDIMSQPSRAIFQFLKANNIVYKDHPVAIRKGEHKSDWYMKINPMGKVPAINDNGFILTESVAILKYLAVRYVVPDHWYPSDPQQRARVDEYMAWQHMNTRFNSAGLFWKEVMIPQMTGKPLDKATLNKAVSELNNTLDMLQTMFLKNQQFLCGDNITIADLLAVNELIQCLSSGRDVTQGRPKLQAWMNRVREKLHPHFDNSVGMIYKLRDMSRRQQARL
ncbi:glutathione S-transferase theta-1-like [Branchiostoma floridae]|uniref:glutathione transferase n=1 Tax=Branchiostoma floridae TaxID=7739 RepID=A0A9J7HT29_BRAFL|nr:glutathione S-transferase theta-1-like [Branchiostoma floridae]XP_035665216.1 glutathione S-transferase theta-1-like [Branchiostoma floridae]